MMTVESFFELFLEELKSNKDLWSYYKFHTDLNSFEFRKAYFCQRLEYIANHIKKPGSHTWDLGCGYGTSALFLALNGYKVHGTTLEFYFKEIPARMKYWSQYGDVSGFTYDYEDLFDETIRRDQFDYIIVQDTLHHLEPLQAALKILHDHLKPNGEMVVIEENGNNIVQSLKLYRQRGNKRIIEFYDERLRKTILLGNENIRSLKQWANEMEKQSLRIDPSSLHYVRVYPPSLFNKFGYSKAIQKEQQLWKANSLIKEYFFFGINFIAKHQPSISQQEKSLS
ncbi:MAG: class I SAM-dependent methyltransferase [Bacteroidetes bacterium]|nr:class I SAM-dependent methyltransferase [Bacteroidota bacterium]